jgi:succinoglycan biosynthesis transport protein ExoP
MKDSREIIPSRPSERREIERPAADPQFQEPASYMPYRTREQQEGSFQVYEYWRAIRKRLWLVVGIAVLVTTLAALYMSRKPNQYRAKAVVQVDLEQANQDLDVNERRSPMMNSDPAYFNTQLQLLTSDSLLRRVVKEMDLENNPEFRKTASDESVSTTQSLLRSLGLATKEEKKEVVPVATSSDGSGTSAEDMKEALRVLPYVDALKRGLIIDPVRESRSSYKDTRLIELSYQHTDPVLAATVVNGVAQVFTRQNFEKRNKTSSETSDFLQDQIADYQTKVKNDEQNLADMTRDNGILKTDGEQTLVIQSLSVLNKQLLEATAERQKSEAKYRAANRTNDSLTALADQQNQSDITQRENIARGLEAQLRQKIDELNGDRSKLLVEFTAEAPEVQELDRKIQTLENAVRTNRSSAQQDIETYRKRAKEVISNVFLADFDKAKNQEAKVKADYDRQYNLAQSQNSAAINMRILEDRLKTNKEFLDSLTKQQRGNNVIAAGTNNNISVVDSALPSDVPVGPRRLMTVGVALILSTLFGAGLALFLEYLDDTIRSTEEVENYLQLPALAAIPTIDTLSRRRLLLVGTGEEGDASRNSELLIHSDSRSSLAEAYRQLRTSILLSTAGHAPKSLLVTSSLPSEGKTTTAVNTAISLAQTGASVLIIDADMRRPRLHSIFGVPNTEGLSSILSSAMPEKDMLDIVSFDESTGLNVLPSGPVPPNPAELIGSDQMRHLLKVMEGNFTHVVVDSPPIASFTDGVLIGSVVDGVILVVHSGKSSKQVVRRSKQFLSEVGAKIFGVVLNNANLRAQDNYYYQSYYHRGYYKHDDESLNG